MAPDLIVYGVVAAGLIFWLRSVLGTRHGDEKERSNPLAPPAENYNDVAEAAYMPSEEKPLSPSEAIQNLSQNPTAVFFVDNKTAENGLLEIAKKDKNFDIHFFLNAAQDAFVMIVEAFARGDKETLRDLLSADVYYAFEQDIKRREEEGEILESEIHAIRKVQVLKALVQDKMAYVTLRFTADETRVHKDDQGEVLSGHPDRVTQMRDIWTLGRDTSSNDPRWLVYETRSDDDDDNEIIPNTDD